MAKTDNKKKEVKQLDITKLSPTTTPIVELSIVTPINKDELLKSIQKEMSNKSEFVFLSDEFSTMRIAVDKVLVKLTADDYNEQKFVSWCKAASHSTYLRDNA